MDLLHLLCVLGHLGGTSIFDKHPDGRGILRQVISCCGKQWRAAVQVLQRLGEKPCWSTSKVRRNLVPWGMNKYLVPGAIAQCKLYTHKQLFPFDSNGSRVLTHVSGVSELELAPQGPRMSRSRAVYSIGGRAAKSGSLRSTPSKVISVLETPQGTKIRVARREHPRTNLGHSFIIDNQEDWGSGLCSSGKSVRVEAHRVTTSGFCGLRNFAQISTDKQTGGLTTSAKVGTIRSLHSSWDLT